MTSHEALPADVLSHRAVVYVRQSSQTQVQHNLESQRRQYELADEARRYGFQQVEVIDDDLGRSASGSAARPGFDKLVAGLCAGDVGAVLCAGDVGAVLCADASRLARNGRDWHHLLELCGLVAARVIDFDGVYDPARPNDRLLLGMKGSISEFELGILRSRMLDALRAKARRGELRISVPTGYVWHREIGLDLDPDSRVQEAIRRIFSMFRALGSARQVFRALADECMYFPRPSDGKTLTSFDWTLIRYRTVIAVLENPFYAGVYVYGKSGKRTRIVDGRASTSYKHGKPMHEWEVLLREHHAGYIDWAEFERNQQQLALNAHGRTGGAKSGRGGRALMTGLLTCAPCGRRVMVVYSGPGSGQPVYRCDRPSLLEEHPRCMSFGARRPDAAITRELLRAVEPLAIEAALMAEHKHMETRNEQRRLAELDLQKARYDASLAERRYAACDPDNRLIAAQLEKHWESALQRVQACEQRIAAAEQVDANTPVPDFTALASELDTAWHADGVTMRTRQGLMRSLVTDILADVDDQQREIVLTIHWRGGQHSQVRLAKAGSGEHGSSTPQDALAVMRRMAGTWPDEQIAATLNRMAIRTGQGKTWTAARVGAIRQVRGIAGYRSAGHDEEWMTMSQAAAQLGVTNHVIRRLIRDRILPAEQLVPRAPYQIRRSELQSPQVIDAIGRTSSPCRAVPDEQLSMFSTT